MKLIDIAKIAKLSYEDEDVFKTKIKKITNPNDIHFIDASIDGYSDAQMYILEYSDKILFTVRGSSSIEDMITNIGLIKTLFEDVQYSANIDNKKYQDIMVHNGFLQQYNTLKFYVMGNIFKRLWEKKYPKPIKVIFSSHSLGAAISSLLSTTLKAHFGSKVYIDNYTFGCPRIGNLNFMKFYDENVDKTHRYVNGNDIVTRIPKFLYAEYNDEIQIGKSDKENFISQNWGNLNDHKIDNYIKGLKRHIEKIIDF